MTRSNGHSDDGDLCSCCMAMCCARGFGFHCEVRICRAPNHVVQVVDFFDVPSMWHKFRVEVQPVMVKKYPDNMYYGQVAGPLSIGPIRFTRK